MGNLTRSIAAGGVATAIAVGAVPAAGADVAARDSTEADLVVRSETPSKNEMERLFVAIWSPKVPVEAKISASYNGENARPALTKLFSPLPHIDYLTLQGRAVGPVRVSGERAKARMAGVMANVPVSTYDYSYRYDGGRWKFDWKRTCAELKCRGNPPFGY